MPDMSGATPAGTLRGALARRTIPPACRNSASRVSKARSTDEVVAEAFTVSRSAVTPVTVMPCERSQVVTAATDDGLGENRLSQAEGVRKCLYSGLLGSDTACSRATAPERSAIWSPTAN
jgi:flavoprotein